MALPPPTVECEAIIDRGRDPAGREPFGLGRI
jgi:hypothetical protein